MDVFVIEGGRSLSGTVRVSGSKNAALPIMACSLLASGTTLLRNVPQLVDTGTLSQLLGQLGAEVSRTTAGLQIDVHDESTAMADYDLVRRMRASVCVLGPLLAKRGQAMVSLPGGCNIGHRPIDVHIAGLTALGAEISVRNGYVMARAKRLRGGDVSLRGPLGSTVTGTCNVMAAACMARGRTVLRDVAREPEVVATGEFLRAMGARIIGLGTSTLEIDGVETLSPVEFSIPPDRIEAATLMIAVGMTGGSMTIEQVPWDDLQTLLPVLAAAGIDVAPLPLSASVTAQNATSPGVSARVSRLGALQPLQATAEPFPGLPTDLQAQLTALLTQAGGESRVTDNVFPERFMHVAELARMGAKIRQRGNSAVIDGPVSLSGAHVMASDLRASAALVIAALAATGRTVIHRIYHLDRGYEQLDLKLRRLGANVTRLSEGTLKKTA